MSTQSRDFAQILDRFSRSIDATPDELHEVLPDELPDELALETRPPAPLPNEPIDAAPRCDRRLRRHRVRRPGPRCAGNAPPTAHPYERGDRPLRDPAVAAGAPGASDPARVPQPELKGALVESLLRLPPTPLVPSGLGVVIVIVGANSAPGAHGARSRRRARSRPRRRGARDPRSARRRHSCLAADERPGYRERATAQLATPRPPDDRRVQLAADVPVAPVGARDARQSRTHDGLGDRRGRVEDARTSRTASTRSAVSTRSHSTTSTTR